MTWPLPAPFGGGRSRGYEPTSTPDNASVPHGGMASSGTTVLTMSVAESSARSSSVRNAARLLKQFSRSERELGPTQLARRLGLAPSTVHRLVSTLADEGLLERGPGGVYRLGLRVYELGL